MSLEGELGCVCQQLAVGFHRNPKFPDKKALMGSEEEDPGQEAV